MFQSEKFLVNKDQVLHFKHGSCVVNAWMCLFQASSIEVKQEWIKNIREVIQERIIHLKGALKEPIHVPKRPAKPRNNSKRSGTLYYSVLYTSP